MISDSIRVYCLMKAFCATVTTRLPSSPFTALCAVAESTLALFPEYQNNAGKKKKKKTFGKIIVQIAVSSTSASRCSTAN